MRICIEVSEPIVSALKSLPLDGEYIFQPKLFELSPKILRSFITLGLIYCLKEKGTSNYLMTELGKEALKV